MKSRIQPYFTLVAFALVVFTMISGCKKKDDDKETANISISMSNTVTARFVYNEVNIDIQQISVNVSTDTNITSGWFDLETNAGIYDLLDFLNGNDTLLAFDPALEVMTINQVRLLLGENNTIVEDGVTYDLDTPSGQTSGIKIPVNVTLQPGLSYIIELDFDPYQSIVETGNNKYKLKPVIQATVTQL